MLGTILLIVAALTLAAYYVSRQRAYVIAAGDFSTLHSRPGYHGLYSALWTAIAGVTTVLAINSLFNYFIDQQLLAALPEDVKGMTDLELERIIIDAKQLGLGGSVGEAADLASSKARDLLSVIFSDLLAIKGFVLLGTGVLAALVASFLTYKQISPAFRSRNRSEQIMRVVLLVAAVMAIATTFGILFSLIGETVKFFQHVPLWKFLFGTHWSPLSGVFEGKVDENTVGAIPLFAGTWMITMIAMAVAVPVGLLSAIYLSEYAGPRVRGLAKPMLEVLAGLPTVVYGFFAALTVAPAIRFIGESIGLAVSAQSALAAGLVMGIMIIPFISSLSDDVINAVPQALRDGSFGLGATKAETVIKVVLPAALPGIVSAIILAVSRAVGETMIVVMAAGQGANLTANPLEAVTTVTVQIVALINGDTDAGTAAGPAFSLGFTLFFITMILNLAALYIVQKYRQKYD